MTLNMDGSVSGLEHELQVSHSLSLPSPSLPRSTAPREILGTQEEQQALQVTGLHRCPLFTSSALSPGQDVTSSVQRSSPHDLTLSCASLHMCPTSQPRPPVIPYSGFLHACSCWFLLSESAPCPEPSSLYLLLIFTQQALSAHLVQCNSLTSFVLPSHSPRFKAMPSNQALTPPVGSLGDISCLETEIHLRLAHCPKTRSSRISV